MVRNVSMKVSFQFVPVFLGISILNYGSHFVPWNGSVCEIVVASIMRNICVKVF